MLLTLPYQAIPIITLILLILPPFSTQPVQTNINSSQQQLTLMTDQQYHFIPVGQFFQYSLASWQEGPQSKYINKISISYNIQILSPNPQYNFMVLYTDSNNQTIASQLGCYVRAINEGLQPLMQSCNFAPNIFASGICNQSIELSANSLFTSSSTFFNCTDQEINYVIQSNSQRNVGPINGTFVFIIDNSGLFSNVNAPTSQIKFILTQQVITNVNEEQKAKLYLFSGLAGILIVIMIIISIVLVCKIRKVDRELTSEQRNKAD